MTTKYVLTVPALKVDVLRWFALILTVLIHRYISSSWKAKAYFFLLKAQKTAMFHSFFKVLIIIRFLCPNFLLLILKAVK